MVLQGKYEVFLLLQLPYISLVHFLCLRRQQLLRRLFAELQGVSIVNELRMRELNLLYRDPTI